MIYFLYTKDLQVFGPLTLSELRRLPVLTPECMVWFKELEEEWLPAHDMYELRDVFRGW